MLGKDFDFSGIKVLIVDDEPDARLLIKQVLARCNATIFMASNADEGVEIVKSNRPDILISDIGMPEKDGYQFIREIRALAPGDGGKMPAIAPHCIRAPEDRTRAMIAGYQVHISKPIEPQELIVAIASLVNRMN